MLPLYSNVKENLINDGELLAKIKSLWGLGKLEEIISLNKSDFAENKDRHIIALIFSQALLKSGRIEESNEYLHKALDWGAPREITLRVVLSTSNQILGRLKLLENKRGEALALYAKSFELLGNHSIKDIYSENYLLNDLNHLSHMVNFHQPMVQSDPVLYVDMKYLEMFGKMFSQSDIDNIKHYNANFFSQIQINNLLEKLLQENTELLNYINNKVVTVDKRIAGEYSKLKNIKINSFPYLYLNEFDEFKRHQVQKVTHNEIRSITLLYPIKNRSIRTTLSIRSLEIALSTYITIVGNEGLKFNVVISEDVSEDLFKFQDFANSQIKISHYLIDTQDKWNKSKVINHALRRIDSDFCFITDCDTLFPSRFFLELEKFFDANNKNVDLLGINMFETETISRTGRIYSHGSPYFYMLGFKTRIARDIYGFCEDMNGFAFEDRDFIERCKNYLGIYPINSFSKNSSLYVLHLSHHHRNGEEETYSNKKILNENVIQKRVAPNWGNQKQISFVKNYCS